MLADWFVAENAYIALSKMYGGLSMASVTGKTYWVDNNDDNAQDASGRGQVTAPFNTVNYAIGQCTADRGDVVLIKPNHAETFSTTTDLDIDVDGVAVIGLQQGNQRPALTFTHASASAVLSGDRVRLEGVELICDVDSQGIMVSITGDGCMLSDCLLYSTAVDSKAPTNIIDVGGNPIGATIAGNRMLFRSTNEIPIGIDVAGGSTRLSILNNQMDGCFTTSAIHLDSAANCYDVLIKGNQIVNTKDVAGGIVDDEGDTDHTGMVCYNVGYCGNAAAMDTASEIAYNQNYFSSNFTLSGTIDPAIS